MALHALACSPDGDDVLVIDGGALTSTKHAWTLKFDHILVAVHFVLPDALPRGGDAATPFRSAAGVELAIAVDAFGAVHAVDPSVGALLFSLPPFGKPVATAASTTSPAFALALEDRIIVWRNGAQDELPRAASALAFDAKGLVFVAGNAVVSGDEATPLPSLHGHAVDLAQLTSKGWWIVGTNHGVHGPLGRIKGGAVRRLIHDGDLIVVQRSDTMIEVYSGAWEPFKRVHYAERTITGVELLPGHVLVVALDGGRTNRIALDQGLVTKTGAGLWKVDVEDGSGASYLTGRIGHRRGVVAIIPVASAAALCVWTLLHSPKPAVPPPRPFHAVPDVVTTTTKCNAGCEDDRFDKLALACGDAPADLRCADTVKEARDAFGVRHCDIAKMELEVLSLRALGQKDQVAPAVVDALTATLDGLSSCATATARYNLLGLRDQNRPPLGLAAPSQIERPLALAVDSFGYVYIATEARGPQRCVLYRRAPTVDTQWTTILTASGCSSAHVFARSEREVYFASGEVVSVWNGTSWSDGKRFPTEVTAIAGTSKPNGDVLVVNGEGIQRLRAGTWTGEDAAPAAVSELFSGGTIAARSKDGAFFARAPNGTWMPLSIANDARVIVTRKADDVFAGGDRGLFHYDGATRSKVMADPVDYLAGNERDVWVITEAD